MNGVSLGPDSQYPEEPVKWIKVQEVDPCSVETNQVDAGPQNLWASPYWFPINLIGAEKTAGGIREAETRTMDHPDF